MKKLLTLLLLSTMCLMFSACGSDKENGKQTQKTQTYALGESVSTDILEITLNKADLAIALENTIGDKYFVPKEYDPADDAKNPYVASKGHTLVAFTFTAANLDRGSIDLGGSFNSAFLTVEYNGQTYEEKAVFGAVSAEGLSWERYTSSNILLLAADRSLYRAYIDIPTDAAQLTDTFNLTFILPNSDGTTTEFTYVVTAQDREKANDQKVELTLEQATANFTKADAREYFKEHLSEYSAVSGSEIPGIVLSKKWDVVYVIKDAGHWSGTFEFEENGVIKDSYGYVNERTWEVSGDNLIFNGKHPCEMKMISDGFYLMMLDGEPYMLLD